MTTGMLPNVLPKERLSVFLRAWDHAQTVGPVGLEPTTRGVCGAQNLHAKNRGSRRGERLFPLPHPGRSRPMVTVV